MFAFGSGLDQRVVGLDHGAVEELRRLARPDFQTRGVERVLQGREMLGVEPAIEIPRRGRIGQARGSPQIQIRFVLPTQLQGVTSQ